MYTKHQLIHGPLVIVLGHSILSIDTCTMYMYRCISYINCKCKCLDTYALALHDRIPVYLNSSFTRYYLIVYITYDIIFLLSYYIIFLRYYFYDINIDIIFTILSYCILSRHTLHQFQMHCSGHGPCEQLY